ncbi:MAG: hypothetical protein UZ18_ATM001000326 [Armatimonadetes bacterium OLB18]|nr:MAG: hypothetical protein UZ18_ATM001000326 [Armatimonadetes bacterium OLB18]
MRRVQALYAVQPRRGGRSLANRAERKKPPHPQAIDPPCEGIGRVPSIRVLADSSAIGAQQGDLDGRRRSAGSGRRQFVPQDPRRAARKKPLRPHHAALFRRSTDHRFAGDRSAVRGGDATGACPRLRRVGELGGALGPRLADSTGAVALAQRVLALARRIAREPSPAPRSAALSVRRVGGRSPSSLPTTTPSLPERLIAGFWRRSQCGPSRAAGARKPSSTCWNRIARSKVTFSLRWSSMPFAPPSWERSGEAPRPNFVEFGVN